MEKQEQMVTNGQAQNENSTLSQPKKKSAIPVPVKKVVDRKVLGTIVAENYQKHSEHKTKQSPSTVKFAAGGNTGRRAATPDVVPKSNEPPGHSASTFEKNPVKVKTGQVTFSLVEEQQQCGLVFKKDSNALRSILTNSGVSVSASGTVSDVFKCQRVKLTGQGRLTHTPGKAALLRNSVNYAQASRMSLIDSCKQYQKALRQRRALEEESASASPNLPRFPTKVSVAESPLVKGMKSEKVSRSVNPVWSHRSLFSSVSTPDNSKCSDGKDTANQNSISVLDKIPETPKTSMAFSRVAVTPDSVKHNSAVIGKLGTPSSSTTYGRVLKETPSHAAELRNSVYCAKGSRMSLIDSCKQYQKTLRQIKGLEEESVSASPNLPRFPTKVSVAESPLVKGMKSEKVSKSVYPVWSHRSLFSSVSTPNNNRKCSDGKDTANQNSINVVDKIPETPKMSSMAFSRVAVTPDSVKYNGTMIGKLGTPSTTYGRVLKETPSLKMVCGRWYKPCCHTTPFRNFQSDEKKERERCKGKFHKVPRPHICPTRRRGFEEQKKDLTQKKLRWADILSACSSPSLAQQISGEALHHEDSDRREDAVEAGTTRTRVAAVREGAGQWRETDSVRLPDAALARHASPSTADTAPDHHGSAGSSLLTVLQQAGSAPHTFSSRRADVIPSRTGLAALSPLSSSPHLHRHVQQGGFHSVCGEHRRDSEDAVLGVERTPEVAACGRAAAEWLAVDATCISQVTTTTTTPSPSWLPPSCPDKVANLQVSQRQVRGTQHEMQLLTMAMQKEQEGDSNGNHVSDVNATTQPTTKDDVSSCRAGQCPGSTDNQLPLDMLLRGPRFDPPLHLQSVSTMCPPTAAHCNRIHRPRVFPAASLSSTSLCDDVLCNVASSAALDPDCSSPADINSNILTSEFTKTETKASGCDPGLDVVGLERGTGDAPPDAWLHGKMDIDTSASLKKLPDNPIGPRHSVNDYDGVGVSQAENTQRQSTIEADAVIVSTLHDSGDTPEPSRNSELSSVKTRPAPLGLLASQKLESDNTFRQSVDMDIEECQAEKEKTAPSPPNESFPPFLPRPLGHLSAPGRDQQMPSSDLSWAECGDQHTVRLNPLSVIMRPSAMVLCPRPEHRHHTAQLDVSPPIWTTLALRSAANINNTSPSGYSDMSAGATSIVSSQPPVLVSPTSPQVMSVAAFVSRSVSLSPKLVKRDKTARRACAIRSSPPSVKPSTSPSKRSPLRFPLRHRQGLMSSSALRHPDLFLEALLEDECALYAGRLQAFLNSPSCDRHHLPDPVASVLNEGDHMHFIPIREDSSSSYRAGREGSAFASYVPVSELQ